MATLENKGEAQRAYTLDFLVLTYNHGKYLIECLESLQKTGLLGSQIRILDDGSNDATPQIVADFAKENPQVVYLRQENTGHVASNTKKLIDSSSADFVLLMSGDDKLADAFPLIETLAIFDSHANIELVIPSYSLITSLRMETEYSSTLVKLLKTGRASEVLEGHLFKRVSRIFLQGSVFRRSFLASLEIDGQNVFQDDFDLVFQTFLKLKSTGKEFAFREDAFWLYREHPENLHKNQLRQFASTSEAIRKYVPRSKQLYFIRDLPLLNDFRDVMKAVDYAKRSHPWPMSWILSLQITSYNVYCALKRVAQNRPKSGGHES